MTTWPYEYNVDLHRVELSCGTSIAMVGRQEVEKNCIRQTDTALIHIFIMLSSKCTPQASVYPSWEKND